jgi:hypothetical protein
VVIECHLKSEASAFEEFAFSKRKKGDEEEILFFTLLFSSWDIHAFFKLLSRDNWVRPAFEYQTDCHLT